LLQRRTRRFARRTVNIGADFSPVNIRLNVPHNIGTVRGIVKNLSPAGLFVELPVLYRVGSRFQVRLELNDKLYTFYGIVWRVEAGQDASTPDSFGHGMKITTASDETLSAIVAFMSAP
jgi:hypothetical protein